MLKPYQTAKLDFKSIKEIGQNGQNSETFIVHDPQLNAEIVTKRIRKDRINSPDELFAESQALYASAHPHVVQLNYACYDDEHVYLAMPYYKNGSLKERITGQYLTVREIITFGSQILAGLHNIHSKGLIHFDIKPDNILISSRGDALVSDFGLAKQTDISGIAVPDRLYGKMVPPEATVHNQLERTFDIYQIGLTLYRMCNGNEHFYAQYAKYGPLNAFDREAFKLDLLGGRFPDRGAFEPHIPVTLQKVIKKCLKVDPSERYQSALHVANAMAGIDGNCLDWRLIAHPDKKVWTKIKDDKEYELTVNADASSICYKSVNGGKRQRVSDVCRAQLAGRELRKFFTDY